MYNYFNSFRIINKIKKLNFFIFVVIITYINTDKSWNRNTMKNKRTDLTILIPVNSTEERPGPGPGPGLGPRPSVGHGAGFGLGPEPRPSVGPGAGPGAGSGLGLGPRPGPRVGHGAGSGHGLGLGPGPIPDFDFFNPMESGEAAGDLDVVMDPQNAVNVKIEASDQNVQQYNLLGFKLLAKYNSTDKHVIALAQFITKYKVVWRYIHSIMSVLINIRHTILAAPRQDELCKLLFEVVDLSNIFNKHLSSREASFFMVQVKGQLLVNVDAFRTSNATKTLQQMIFKVRGFQFLNLPMIFHIDPMASMIKTPSKIPLYNRYRDCHLAMRELFD
jgi:hypothetical protein